MKQLLRAALRKAGFELTRVSPPVADLEREYVRRGRIPWSHGYNDAKEHFILEALSDPRLLELFRKDAKLSEGFGLGFDERCVEYPWLLARLKPGPEHVLDAGSALNHAFILAHPVLQEKKLTILTLAPEQTCFWQRGISYIFDDVCDIPIRNAYYDNVACISTLEHVGCDNRLYTNDPAHREHRPERFALAMQELCRVLKPGGSLFLTVPFGVYGHFGTFQQFDKELLCHTVEAFGKARTVVETFYKYSALGWNVSDATDCAECQYVEWITRPHEQWPKPIPVEPDLAAAARAVACVQIVKG